MEETTGRKPQTADDQLMAAIAEAEAALTDSIFMLCEALLLRSHGMPANARAVREKLNEAYQRTSCAQSQLNLGHGLAEQIRLDAYEAVNP
jgi:hypothetical protein